MHTVIRCPLLSGMTDALGGRMPLPSVPTTPHPALATVPDFGMIAADGQRLRAMERA
jgi:hypothetical protein